jgi:hypothetical protein
MMARLALLLLVGGGIVSSGELVLFSFSCTHVEFIQLTTYEISDDFALLENYLLMANVIWFLLV